LYLGPGYVLSLFNKIFDIAYFPDYCCEGYVIPLHKTGNINDAYNYKIITFYRAFIDFSKAFDNVEGNYLWFLLIRLGIRGKIVNIIRSMYQNFRLRVE